MKDILLKKIKFQISKMNILKEYDEIFIVLDFSLKNIFLKNVDYFFSEIKKYVSFKAISYEIVKDFADREILIIKFDY
ncbi:TPA: hypothetical protein I9Z34_003058 [Clostridium perfringens]|nr:hypothetical protein [Clostridium perfringens]